MNRELFGTDGVRGLAGQWPLDENGALRIGRAIGTFFGKPGVPMVMACDPRQSSSSLVKQVSAGIRQTGVDIVFIGILPTPGLSFVTRQGDFSAGVMITASHNPVEYNGVKVFDEHGDKLTDDIEAALNKLIESDIEPSGQGQMHDDKALLKSYEDFLVEQVGALDLSGMKIAVDSANGAASGIAARLFERLGAAVTALFDKPNGKNINDHCGATDTAALAEAVMADRLDLGVALDGDADRLVMIDGRGREVKGDYIMYTIAVANHVKGVVATDMSNLGFEESLEAKGIKVLRTRVGDRYVLEGLRSSGFHLGGEQSGHIILSDILATGDGLLAALQTVRAVKTSDKSLAEWCDEVKLLPQALVNFPLINKKNLELPVAEDYIKSQQAELTGKGRLIVRPSGTEPLGRVMVEADNADALARQIANHLEELCR